MTRVRSRQGCVSQRENHKRAPGGEKLPPKSDAQLAASLEERKKEEADAKPKLIVNGETVSAESDSFRAAMTFFDPILVLAVVAAGLLFGFVLEEYFTRITVGAASGSGLDLLVPYMV